MNPRWFNIAVLLLWLSTMGWLLTEKVLPPLLVGEPPKYETVLDEASERNVPIAWSLDINNTPLGWATSETNSRPDGIVEMISRVHLERFPLAELAPSWLSNIFDPRGSRKGEMEIDTESTFELAAGKLQGFYTRVDLGPLKEAILVSGIVDGTQLRFSARAGEFVYSKAHDLPGDALVGDGLSPRSRLARLRVGQVWTEPMYSPFHQPNNPMQILQATVEHQEPLAWNGDVVNTVVVVYRNDPGSELNGSRLARGRAWVRDDGTVLKQEVQLFGSRLVFTRLPPGEMPWAGAEIDAARLGKGGATDKPPRLRDLP